MFSGPLTILSKNRIVQIGISSTAAVICGIPAYPSYYSRVFAVRDWIMANSDAAKWQCE